MKTYKTNQMLLDSISPITIFFDKTYTMMGDRYIRAMLVTNYNTRVEPLWLSRVSNVPNVTISMHVVSTESDNIIDSISKNIGDLKGKIASADSSAINLQRWEQQLDDAKVLLKKVDLEGEHIFFVTITVLVNACSVDELNQSCRRIEAIFSSENMKLKTAAFRQEQALVSAGPFGILHSDIASIASRNMPASTIAGSFPFQCSGLNDMKGFILGNSSGDLVLLDIWQRGADRINSNIIAIGPPGIGKSTILKKFIYNEFALGTKIIVIDPEDEYKELCTALGGKWINCGGGNGSVKINPYQIRYAQSDDDDEINPLQEHMQFLRTFHALYFSELTEIEEAYLENIIESVYKIKIGIDYDSSIDDIKNIKQNEFPVLSDFYEYAQKLENGNKIDKEAIHNIVILLKKASVGADSKLWNGNTNVKTNQDFVVMSIKHMGNAPDKLKQAQYFNLLTWAWQEIINDHERILFVIDETTTIVDQNIYEPLRVIRNISKGIRKRNGGLITVFHSPVEILHENIRQYGQSLIDTSAYKIIMGVDGKGLEELTNILHLTETEQDILLEKKRGNCLFFFGSKRINVCVDVSEDELLAFGKGGGE